MKQKLKGFLSILIIFLIILVFGMNSVNATEERTRMIFQQDGQEETKIHLKIMLSENIGASSIQTNIQLKTNQLQEIENVSIDWSTGIQNQALLKTIEYHKETGILNVYIVSKTDLGRMNDSGEIELEIGTLKFQTQNTEEMMVELIAGNTTLANVSHTAKEILPNTVEDKLSFNISSQKEVIDPEQPSEGGDKPSENPKGDSQNPEHNNRPNDQSGNSSDLNSNTNPKDALENKEQTENEDHFLGKLPFTGMIKDHKVLIISILIGLIILAVILIRVKQKIKAKH